MIPYQLPAVTDSVGHFLHVGKKATWRGRPSGTGTITTYGHGWVRLRTDSGKAVTKKPTRIKVAA